MYKFDIKEISKEEALEMVKKHHYSNTLPKLNKHFIGFFLDDVLVGVVTLGWGTRPRHTIQRIFPSLDTKDYLEIGRMCMLEEMPRNSESQMLSQLVKWMKVNLPEIKILFTWADGMVGKVGYVYQASNFIYAGYSGGEMYMKDGVKIHVRQMKSFLIPEGVKDTRITVRPTVEQMKQFNIQHFKGKQYRYLLFLCDKKERKRLLNECLIDLTLPRPKDDDLSWTIKDLDTGKWVESKKPPYVTDVDQKTKDLVKMEGKEEVMVFYDIEVFKYDWLVVIMDMTNKKKHVVINDVDQLTKIYEEHKDDIWVGFNNKHYDQYIFKSILLGMDPKTVNDAIIVEGKEGWSLSSEFRNIKMINYDVMPNPPIGLKTLEGFMGSNIKETDVDFNIDRKLTQEELKMTEKYCTHDVEQTIEVFMKNIDNFNAMMGIVKAFNLPLECVGDSESRITAKVLGCQRQDFDDEFDIEILPCIQLKKYKYVQEWFETIVDKTEPDKIYKQSLNTLIAGVPHTFGFGGLHGASATPIHRKGSLWHVDVNNYYPSLLIAHGLVTRAATNNNFKLVYDTRKELKYKQTHAKEKAEAKKYKQMQLPYKKLLNSLTGGMKDKTNPAYDPRNNNRMCINGQLMLLDLIEHLEVIEGFELIQSNTDGLIVMIPDTDEAFNMMDDICWDWECRCSTELCDIRLETDALNEIYQKDVNNYLWVDFFGGVERKGAYVKELSSLDNDLPILNKALVEYMVHKTPVETTINNCNDLIEFQKIVKLSNKYHHVEHEHCEPTIVTTGVRVKKQHLVYESTDEYTYKAFRVFASQLAEHGRILKCRDGKKDKFGNTPDHCFIFNDDVNGVKCPWYLDKQYYVTLAKKRLKDYGIET